jgi:hypothetical protein
MSEYPFALDVDKEIGSSGKYRFMFLRDGENLIRFLPPWSEDRIAFYRTWVHYGVGKSIGFVFCPRYMAKLPCPICEYVDGMVSKGVSRESELVRDFIPKQRYLSNVLDLNHKDDGVKVLMYPRMVYDEFLPILRDTKNFGDFTHYKTGFPLRISRTQSGTARHMRRYSVLPIMNRGPVEEQYLKQLYNLFQVAELLSYDELSRLLNQAVEQKSPVSTGVGGRGVEIEFGSGNVENDLSFEFPNSASEAVPVEGSDFDPSDFLEKLIE